MNLRAYQVAARDAIAAAEARGVRRQLVQMPTGTGKTVLFAHIIAERDGRALVLAHRDELLDQAAEKIRAVWPDAVIGKVKAERDEHAAPTVVASVQTLARPSRLSRVSPDFDLVGVDEGHHAAADTYRRILGHLGAFEPDGPLTLGFTATPARADGAALVGPDGVFEAQVYTYSLRQAIAEAYLADLRAIQVALDADFSKFHVRQGDYVTAEVADAFAKADAPHHIAAAYSEHAPGRRGLVFCPTVALAHETAEALVDAGIAAEALDAATPDDERRAMLSRLRSGETRAVCNCSVLTEGFDLPTLDAVVIARPTRSQPLYLQMIGRAMRRWPGKSDALILDCVGATSRHDLVTAPVALGLRDGAMRDGRETFTEALEQERAREQREGRLVAREVDLLRPLSRLAWVSTGRGFVLSVEDGRIELRGEGARYVARHLRRDGGEEVVADAASLELALGVAEDHVRSLGVGHLVKRDAAWRQLAATPKQLAALRRLRVAPPPGVTRGEASDAIARRIAELPRSRRSA